MSAISKVLTDQWADRRCQDVSLPPRRVQEGVQIAMSGMSDLLDELIIKVQRDCNRYCEQQWAWARERWRLYETFRRLSAEGWTQKDIAKKLGVSAARLSQIRGEMEDPKFKRNRRPVDDKIALLSERIP